MNDLIVSRSLIAVGLMTIVTGLFISCATSNVVQYINEDSNFESYHTFKIINYKTDNKEYSTEGNAFVDSVEYYIGLEMQNKGYKPGLKPDLLVRYELISGVESDVNYNNNYYGGAGRGYYSPFYDPYYYGPRATRHIEGIFLLEIKVRKTKKLVWQGSLDLKYSKKKKDSNLGMMQEAIIKIFETYPYQAGRAKPVILSDK